MDHVTSITFTCEICKTKQDQIKTWQLATRPSPAKGDRSKAMVTCKVCGHEQIAPVPRQ